MLLLDNFVDIFPTFQFQSVFIHLFLHPAPSAQLKVTICWMDESQYFLDIWIITSKCIFCDVQCALWKTLGKWSQFNERLIISYLNKQVNILFMIKLSIWILLSHLKFLGPKYKTPPLEMILCWQWLKLDHAVAVRVAPVLLPAGLPVTNQRWSSGHVTCVDQSQLTSCPRCPRPRWARSTPAGTAATQSGAWGI